MTSSELTKIGENEFRIDFETECYYTESKSVVVDGEEYTKNWYRVEKINSKVEFDNAGEIVDYRHKDCNIDKSKGDKWDRIVIKDFFDYNGQIYYVWNYNGFIQDPSAQLRSIYSNSTVGYVNILICLVEGKHVKKIHNIWTDKQNGKIKIDAYNELFKHRRLEFSIYNYGFNNCVKIDYSVYNLLNIDFTKIANSWFCKQMKFYSDYYFPKLFPKKIFTKKLNDIDKTEIAIEILNNSINFKQQKK